MYRGLEPTNQNVSVTLAQEGRNGIAAQYEGEGNLSHSVSSQIQTPKQ
jgi:hypothetical protein